MFSQSPAFSLLQLRTAKIVDGMDDPASSLGWKRSKAERLAPVGALDLGADVVPPRSGGVVPRGEVHSSSLWRRERKSFWVTGGVDGPVGRLATVVGLLLPVDRSHAVLISARHHCRSSWKTLTPSSPRYKKGACSRSVGVSAALLVSCVAPSSLLVSCCRLRGTSR